MIATGKLTDEDLRHLRLFDRLRRGRRRAGKEGGDGVFHGVLDHRPAEPDEGDAGHDCDEDLCAGHNQTLQES